MTRLAYVIEPVPGGWRVTCNGVSGPAYATRNEAVRDTLSAAGSLRKEGNQVGVRLFEIDGTGRSLETQDARLFHD